MDRRILIVNGPNLNLLGTREPSVYGGSTLEELVAAARSRDYGTGVAIDHFQSNHEGELIDRIQEASGRYDLLVINAGGLTHTSVCIRDAVLASGMLTVEVHISNIFAREPFRRASLLSDVAACVMSGAGKAAYGLAVEAGLSLLAEKDRNKSK